MSILCKVLVYFILFSVSIAIVMGITTIVFSWIIPYLKEDKCIGFTRFLLYFWSIFVPIFFRTVIKLEGREKLKGHDRILFVGNHRSKLDPVIALFCFPKNRLVFVSKPENFQIPWIGKLIKHVGYMSVNREDAREALKTINQASSLIKSKKASVCIYPEGTRNKTDADLLPFRNGSLKIAKKAECSIAILSLIGTANYHFFKPYTLIHATIVDLIDKDEVMNLSTNELGEKVKYMLLDDFDKYRN